MMSVTAALLASLAFIPTLSAYEKHGDTKKCPLPVWPALSSSCHVIECRNDRDCHNETMCCYNGCKKTCLRPLEPPSAFDWTEETPEIKIIAGLDGRYEAQEGLEESVATKEGCILSPNQYSTLEDFSHNSNINQCFCNDRGVYCEVLKR